MNYELFPVRIRTATQIAQIQKWYEIGQEMARETNSTEKVMRDCIAVWMLSGTDDCLALAVAYQEALDARAGTALPEAPSTPLNGG
jgi:hypothetical protein